MTEGTRKKPTEIKEPIKVIDTFISLLCQVWPCSAVCPWLGWYGAEMR